MATVAASKLGNVIWEISWVAKGSSCTPTNLTTAGFWMTSMNWLVNGGSVIRMTCGSKAKTKICQRVSPRV